MMTIDYKQQSEKMAARAVISVTIYYLRRCIRQPGTRSFLETVSVTLDGDCEQSLFSSKIRGEGRN